MTQAPPAGRIEVLDVLRGVAILAIVLMNVPWQAASIPAMLDDVRRLGWTPADRATWIALDVLVEGTQRCLLEFLFGAGVLLLSRRLDGWEYLRRNLWLLAFGLVDIFALLWVGDILAAYAIAGLLVFPMRQLLTRALVALGLGFAFWSMSLGGALYAGERAYATALSEARHARIPEPGQAHVLELAKDHERSQRTEAAEQDLLLAKERRAHAGGVRDYAGWYWWLWVRFNLRDGLLIETVIEAASTMLLGMALLRAGVIQGARSRRFYLAGAAGCYAVGLALRAIVTGEVVMDVAGARLGWIVEEPARLVMGLAHLCAINLLWQTRARAVLRPFAAAGRTALSLYLLAQAIGMHLLFAPYGLLPWGRLGWAGMTGVALALMAVLLLTAHLWLLRFRQGPAEWAWRALAAWPHRRLCAPQRTDRSG